jgi:hypothetical protein
MWHIICRLNQHRLALHHIQRNTQNLAHKKASQIARLFLLNLIQGSYFFAALLSFLFLEKSTKIGAATKIEE